MAFKILNGLLDPDERASIMRRKIDYCQRGYAGVPFRDPAKGMVKEIGHGDFISVPVEDWLIPTPPEEMLFMLTVENFVTFIDSNGCLDYSKDLGQTVRKVVFPELPIMFGVDHSLSGGVIEAAADEYGGENLRLVVMDSHFDFIPTDLRCGLIQYDIETNSKSKFASDPYAFNRKESYNADSFLSYMLKKVPPENVFVVGVSDYPPKLALSIEDPRVKRYVEFYKGLESSGVHVIRKEDILSDRARAEGLLSKTDKPMTYLSIDVDVCANTSLKGARFLNFHGLSVGDFYALVGAIGKSLKSSRLAGLDFMEFDVYNAGATVAGKTDHSYQIMAEAFRRIMPNTDKPTKNGS